jgi:hypothetical protein
MTDQQSETELAFVGAIIETCEPPEMVVNAINEPWIKIK